MADHSRASVIGPDLIIKGDIRNGGDLEVRGYVEGSISARRVTVHPGGRVFGTVKSDAAEVNGQMQGTMRVKTLIAIGATGSVAGDVRYGQLTLAPGGDLNAEVRNVPPELAGDFDLSVRRGGSVRITTADLTAVDPDNRPEELTYRVSGASGGHVARARAEADAIETFSEAELAAGEIVFVHDGAAERATFEVSVRDAAGATSGDPQGVRVTVR